MKIDRYRELMSRIDTDKAMDEKILKKLAYHSRRTQKPAHDVNYDAGRNNMYTVTKDVSNNRRRILRQAFPSFAFLIILLIAVIGIRMELLNNKETSGGLRGASTQTGTDSREEPYDGETAGEEPYIITPEPADVEYDAVHDSNLPEKSIDGILRKSIEGLVRQDNDLILGGVDSRIIFSASVLAEGEFYEAWFEAKGNDDFITSLPSLIITLKGTAAFIDPNDLTDVVLTRDNIAVDNRLVYKGEINRERWWYEGVTDFYFEFENENTEPGIYGLTGKYKGVPFTAYYRIVESYVTKEEAKSKDLLDVSWEINDYGKGKDEVIIVRFRFSGRQNTFRLSDLTDCKLIRDNKVIPYSFFGNAARDHIVSDDGSGTETSYRLLFSKSFAEPGIYIFSGKYQGVAFATQSTVIDLNNEETEEIEETDKTAALITPVIIPVTGYTYAKQAAPDGDFYFAMLDEVRDNNVKTSIPNLIVRLHGNVDTINPEDLTEVVLTRDGAAVDNALSYTGKKQNFSWQYENITDFYFAFDRVITEPGIYGLTGRYKGVSFEVTNKALEAAVTAEAADGEDLLYAAVLGSIDENGEYIRLTELSFAFDGLQNTFYPSDLTDCVLTRNGKEVSFDYMGDIFRYYETYNGIPPFTSYHLILQEALTEPGAYVLTGKYQGIPFASITASIP